MGTGTSWAGDTTHAAASHRRAAGDAGGVAAEDAPAAAQASGRTDVLAVSVVIVAAVTVLSWRVWTGGEEATTGDYRPAPSGPESAAT